METKRIGEKSCEDLAVQFQTLNETDRYAHALLLINTAVAENRLDVVQWLFGFFECIYGEKKGLFAHEVGSAVYGAVEGGFLEIVQEFQKQFGNMIADEILEAFPTAIERGHLSVVRDVLQFCGDTIITDLEKKRFVETAVQAESIEILAELFAGRDYQYLLGYAFEKAIEFKRQNVLRWALLRLQRNESTPNSEPADDDGFYVYAVAGTRAGQAVEYAIESKDLSLLRFCVEVIGIMPTKQISDWIWHEYMVSRQYENITNIQKLDAIVEYCEKYIAGQKYVNNFCSEDTDEFVDIYAEVRSEISAFLQSVGLYDVEFYWHFEHFSKAPLVTALRDGLISVDTDEVLNFIQAHCEKRDSQRIRRI